MRETQPFFINEMPITQGAASESLWGGGARGRAVIGTRAKAGSREPPEVGRTRGGSGFGGAGPAGAQGAPEWTGRHSSQENRGATAWHIFPHALPEARL